MRDVRADEVLAQLAVRRFAELDGFDLGWRCSILI
jgi:hypothetical protein